VGVRIRDVKVLYDENGNRVYVLDLVSGPMTVTFRVDRGIVDKLDKLIVLLLPEYYGNRSAILRRFTEAFTEALDFIAKDDTALIEDVKLVINYTTVEKGSSKTNSIVVKIIERGKKNEQDSTT